MAVNSYVAILVVTIVASFATIYIIHIAHNLPFKAFASTDVYSLN